MELIRQKRRALKTSLRNRDKLFAGWVSYSHPSITETFAQADFDFIVIDMEHAPISLEQGQRIIAASQAYGTPCLPRPVSHSMEYFKPLLDSGADGLLVQMVNTTDEVENIVKNIKYPPTGSRTYGVNRAQGYGFDSEEYFKNWNRDSIIMLQIESKEAVDNIDMLLVSPEVEGVMIGPYDLAGSLGVPGETTHPRVQEATRKVVDACEQFGKSCGTQVVEPTQELVDTLFESGYTFVVLASDLFVLWKWAEEMKKLISSIHDT
jgi:2-dehydro-3-deoxyglucarate aldolase